MTANDPVVILAAKRTPIGDFQGSLASIKATELGSTAIKGLFSDSSIEPQRIDQVFMGCVLSAGLGQAPARQASLGADLPSAQLALLSTKCAALECKLSFRLTIALLANSKTLSWPVAWKT